MTDSLKDIHAASWSALSTAAQGDNPLRILTLATVTPEGWPEARSIVLRRVEERERLLEFHTDVRSGKWHEVGLDGRATVLGWDPDRRTQLRLSGRIYPAGPGREAAARAWEGLSKWSKLTYTGPAPATPLKEPRATNGDEPEEGREQFGVLLFQALSLDWCQLERGNNRRAYFEYEEGDVAPTATWIAT
ncbi:MAG: pyridoxamine 5'-phosphate oxidase [Sulfitobacter sp.]|nr:pyridoxamine 5'-phosphate oxidase [Sulfitobacter sp.]